MDSDLAKTFGGLIYSVRTLDEYSDMTIASMQSGNGNEAYENARVTSMYVEFVIEFAAKLSLHIASEYVWENKR